MSHLHFGVEGFGPLLIYSGGIVAFLLAVFWKPQVGLYYLVLLLPLQTWRYRVQGYPLGPQFVDVLLLGIILGLALQQGKVFTKTSLDKLFAVFALYYYISLWLGAFYLGGDLPLWFSDPRWSEWKNYMVMPLLCLVTVAVIKDEKQMKILIVVMCVSVLLVNRSLYNVLSGRDLSHFDYDLRESGPLGYAGENGLAAFEAQFSLLLLGLYAFEKRALVKLALMGVVISSMYCLLFSFSRGGYLGFLAGLIFLGVFKERKLLLVVAAVLVAWQTLLPTAVQERITMTYDESSGTVDSSAAERLSLWDDAVSLVDQNPVLGTGFNTYEYLHRVGPYTDTHNYYLKALVETGVIGLILLLWLLGKGISLGYTLFRSADDQFLKSLGLGLAALIVCAVVVNFFGDRWVRLQVNGFLWTLLGCVARGQLMVQQTKARVIEKVSAIVSPGPQAPDVKEAVAV